MRALPAGNGRSYGDSALNPGGALWLTRGLDRFIAFDAASGVLRAQAGVLLAEIIEVALPSGWFLPVTPGTRWVTLGGAVANDVHGKNHHVMGSFGEHVRALLLKRSDGSVRECSRLQHADWLTATIGGLGLTGLIEEVELQLLRVPGPCIRSEALPFDTLDQFFALADTSEAAHDYTVSWIDCLHGGAHAAAGAVRGVFFRGNHVAAEEAEQGAAALRPPHARTLPMTPPVSLVNRLSLRAFNTVYHRAQVRRRGPRTTPLWPFFYPLDSVDGWNKLYGPRGFYQYQCVVPTAVQGAATDALLRAIRVWGSGSFLAVLKTFADRPAAGLLSFPMAGTTLALDFPNEGARTLTLFETLDAIVADAGGRLYMAKDARMSRAMFRSGYPRHAEFAGYRDPLCASGLSRRLLDDD